MTIAPEKRVHDVLQAEPSNIGWWFASGHGMSGLGTSDAVDYIVALRAEVLRLRGDLARLAALLVEKNLVTLEDAASAMGIYNAIERIE